MSRKNIFSIMSHWYTGGWGVYTESGGETPFDLPALLCPVKAIFTPRLTIWSRLISGSLGSRVTPKKVAGKGRHPVLSGVIQGTGIFSLQMQSGG